MLTAIRNKASSWVVKGLFAFLVASFAVWGIGDIFRSGGHASPAIEVGDIAISPQTLQQQFNAMMRNLGGRLDAETAKQMGLGDRVVRQAIDDALLQVETRRLRLAVPPEFARQVIVGNPRFFNQQGQFQREIFDAFLSNEGMNEGQYLQQLQSQIAQRQLFASLAAGAAAPKAMLDDLHAYRAETRVAKTLLLPPSVAGEVAEPDDAALNAYYKDHENDFLAPEYRTLVLVVIAPQDVAKGIQIADDKLQQEYDARKDQFSVPEQRHVVQFLVDDEAAAKAAAERLKSEDFATVAKAVSGQDPIDLGTVDKAGLPLAEVADPVFAAAEGSVVGPVKSDLGWHLLKVEKVEPAHQKSFDEAKDELRSGLVNDLAAAEVVSRANKLDDALAGGATLEDAAAQVGATAQKIAAVDRSGKAPDGSPVAPLADNPALLGLAFQTAEGETSPQHELPDRSQVTIRVDRIQAAAARPLEEVRAKVVEAWKQAERDKALAAKADALAERARGGASLDDIAAELSLKAKTSAAFTRDAGDPASDIDAGVAAKLFGAKANDVVTAQSTGGYILAELTEVHKAEPLKPEEMKGLEDEVERGVTNDMLRQFVSSLRGDIEVTTNKAVIDQLF
jgi:peptidyl-prolyl cis-trans isomerase D